MDDSASAPTPNQVAFFQFLLKERAYQDKLWPNHRHSLSQWLVIAMARLSKACCAWAEGDGLRCCQELMTAAAVICAALEEHGVFPAHQEENHEA